MYIKDGEFIDKYGIVIEGGCSSPVCSPEGT